MAARATIPCPAARAPIRRAGDDFLAGNEGADELYGREGADFLYGGPGDDALSGGLGIDRLEGGPGDDVLDGIGNFDRTDDAIADLLIEALDEDADALLGGDGGDTILLGAGDVATGGEGGDTFVVGDWIPDGAAAQITDFDPTLDSLDVGYTGPDLPDLKLTPFDDETGTSVVLNGIEVARVAGGQDLTEAELNLFDRSESYSTGAAAPEADGGTPDTGDEEEAEAPTDGETTEDTGEAVAEEQGDATDEGDVEDTGEDTAEDPNEGMGDGETDVAEDEAAAPPVETADA